MTVTAIKIECTGTAPLLMHSDRLVDEFDPLVRKIKEVNAKKTNKTDEDKLYVRRLEWEAGMYWSEATGPYIPGANIKRSIQEVAKKSKNGKNVLKALHPWEGEIRLEYDGPRNPQDMWNDGRFVDTRSVTVQRNKILRTRPRFDHWSFETALLVDKSVLNIEDLHQWIATAGIMEGLGDYRPTFGRFQLDNMEEIDVSAAA